MLKAFTPVSTMLCAFLFHLERPSARLIATVCCICVGVCAASLGELNFSAFGVFAMLVSIAAEGLRIVMMQHLLASKQFNPIEAWLYLGPACCIWLAVLIGVSEVHQIQDAHGLSVVAMHPWHFGFAALAGFAVNVLAMCVIKLASALTLKVLGICKDVGLVTFSAMLLGEHVTGLQLAGYGVSVLGFGCYNYVKAADAGAAGSQAAAATHGPGRQQQQQVLLQGTKGKLPRTPSPLRRKQGMIGTATMPVAGSPAAAAAAAAEEMAEPLLPRGVSIKVLV
jgi:drug/metabolite transporter (DMT)-like permease